jgi:hypothetical protein
VLNQQHPPFTGGVDGNRRIRLPPMAAVEIGDEPARPPQPGGRVLAFLI